LQRSKRRSPAGVSRHHQKLNQDAAIEITYPGTGNFSCFGYDGLDRVVRIEETIGGSISEVRQFVLTSFEKLEERNSGGAITKRFFNSGTVVGEDKYFYTSDHLGSIREVVSSSPSQSFNCEYSPYGKFSSAETSAQPDFGFSGYHYHARSTLYLAVYRAYNKDLGRWLSRDKLSEIDGANLYSYVNNSPIAFVDHLGLTGTLTICAVPSGEGQQKCCGDWGHSWINWQPDKGSKGPAAGTYGSWQGHGVRHNYLSDINGAKNYKNARCRSKKISDEQELALASSIKKWMDKGKEGWTARKNCARFAHDMWLAGTGEDLPHRHGQGYPHPDIIHEALAPKPAEYKHKF